MKFKISELLFIFGIIVALFQNIILYTILGIIIGFSINEEKYNNIKLKQSNSLIIGITSGCVITQLFPIIIGIMFGSGLNKINELPQHEKLNYILKYVGLRADQDYIYY